MSAMEMEDGVEQWIRANVFSLVSALGGPGVEDGRYKLGHEGLAVFKDLKRWAKAWDLDKGRHDVARACAEANLVKGDLLEILATWSGDEQDNRLLTKASLYSTDLLTILTWPLHVDEKQATAQSVAHGPYLDAAQAIYKRAILHHDHAKILRQTVRVCLPSLAIARNEREGWDDAIIKIVLYLYRNIAAINEPERIQGSEDDNEISRHATIDAFHQQDVFTLLLTIGSGLGDEFDGHDTEMLEVLFQICKGIDVDRLFMEKDEIMSANTKELQGLMAKEKDMLSSYAKTGPTRHNKFGTMMWLKRDEGRYLTVLGQTAANEQTTLHSIDKGKKWKKPRRPNRNPIENPLYELNANVALTASARRHLRSFVEQFLDSSFNPLFTAMRRSITSGQDRVLDHHNRMYFFMIAWFLRAERARRRKRREAAEKANSGQEETETFGLVAAVLNQETLILLNRSMQTALDNKEWQNMTACMRCFTEILHTVQEMLASAMEDDQEIAENTLNRIFYEQTTHDRIVALLRSYKDQGFGYLDACTDLAHTFIRLLEQYSKQNVDMQVRSIRRVRKKKKEQAQAAGDNPDVEEDRVMDVAEAQRQSTERSFDFKKFAARFVNQATIETFTHLLRYYKELTTDQLKRAHRFLYRAAFKMEMSVFLMRMDIVQLLHKMVQGPEPLNSTDAMFKDWEELARQVFRRLVRKMEERPALAVEVLFTKIPNTAYYLEHGYDPEPRTKAAPRAPAELEIKPGANMDKEQQIGVAVAILVNQAKSDHLAWVKSVLASGASERQAWDAEAEARMTLARLENEQRAQTGDESLAEPTQGDEVQTTDESQQHQQSPAQPKSEASPILVKPDNDERRKAMTRDKFLRLLLSLIGFDKLDITDSDIDRDGFLTSWTIPGSLSAADLTQSSELIARFEFSPPSYDDGKSAEDHVRNKSKPSAGSEPNERSGTRRYEVEDASDSEGGSIASDLEGALFPAGGPTPREPDQPKKRKLQRRRNRHEKDDLIPESVLEARREARRRAEQEKAAKIKSQLFISPSDDESDNERDRDFFAREARLRVDVGREVSAALAGAAAPSKPSKARKSDKPPSKKRKATPASDDDSGSPSSDASARKRRSTAARRGSDASASSATASATASDSEPLSDAGVQLPPRRRRAAASTAMLLDGDAAETDAETDTPPTSSLRSAGRGPDEGGRRGMVHSDDVGAGMASDGDDGGSDKENAGPAPTGRQLKRRALVIDSDDDD